VEEVLFSHLTDITSNHDKFIELSQIEFTSELVKVKQNQIKPVP
jgi:hypothetical protein